MTPAPEVRTRRPWALSPTKISLIYVLVGSLWVLLSDALFYTMAENMATFAHVHVIEDLVFVLAMAGLAYFLLTHFVAAAYRAYDALQESEERYRLLVEASPDDIAVVDPSGQLVMINQQGAQLHGFDSPEDMLKSIRNAFDLVPPQDQERARSVFRRLMETGAIRTEEFNLLRRDGGTFPVEASGSALAGADGRPKAVLVVLRDITERRRAEEALARSERLHRSVIEAVGGVPYSRDFRSDTYPFVGEGIAELTGCPQEEFTPAAWDEMTREVVPTGRYAGLSRTEALEKMRREGSPVWCADYRIRTRGGEERWIYCSAVDALDEQGRSISSVGMFLDITERKRAAEALEKSERLYRGAIETAGAVPYYRNYATGGYDFVGPGVEALTGYSVKEFTPDLWDSMVQEAVPMGELQGLPFEEVKRRILTGEVRSSRIDFRVKTRADGERWIADSSVEEYDKPGKAIGTLGLLQDITDRKRAAEALEKSERLYRGAIEAAGAVPYYRDFVTGRYDFVGPGIEALTGYSVEESTPDRWHSMIQETVLLGELQGLSDEEAERRFRSGETRSHQGELRVRTRTGEERWLSDAAVHVKDDRGKPFASLGVLQDITERRQAEQRLAESERKYRTLFEQAADSIVLVDFETGALTEFNTKAHESLGYTREEFAKLTIPDIDAAQSPEEVARNIERIKREGGAAFETVQRTKSGELRNMLVNSKTVTLGGKLFGQCIVRDITDQKRAEVEIRRSEKKFRELYEGSRDGYVMVNMEGYIREFNQAYKDMLGYSDDELRRRTYMDITPAKWHEMQAEIIDKQVLARGYSELYEKEYRRKDGTIVPIELRTYLIRDEHGAPSGMWAFIRDITERKRAEQALRESEERFRAIFQSAPVGISIHSPDGRYKQVNPAYQQMLGYTEEELRNLSIRHVTHPDDRDEGDGLFQDLLAGKREYYQRQKRYVRKDGRIIWAEVIRSVLRDVKGEVTDAFSLVNDITYRKQAEEELFNSRQMLRLVLDTVPQRVFWKDRDSVFLGCNKALAQDCGYADPGELVGKTDHETTTAATADLYRADDRRVIETGRPKLDYEEPQIKPDGSRAWLRTSKVPLRDRDGRVIGVLGTYEDITEKKRAGEALRESEERFRAIFQSAPVGISIYTLDQVYKQVNPAYQEMVGYTEDELRRMGFRDFTHPDDKEEGDRLYRELLDGKREYYRRQKRYVRKDGRVLWVEVVCSLLHDAQGKATHAFSIVQDITGRKKAEEALRGSEERFRIAAQSANDLIYEWDVQSGRLEWFGDVDAALGYGHGEFPRTVEAWEAAIHPDDRERVLEALKKSVQAGNLFSEEYRVLRRDGSVHNWTDRGVLSRGAKGEAGKFVGAVSDVTARKRAEEALRKSEARYRTLFDAGQDGVFLFPLKADGMPLNFIEVNNAACRLLGYTREEFLSKSPTDIIAPEFHEMMPALGSRLIENGHMRAAWEDIAKNGRRVPVDVSVTLFELGGQRISMAVVRDITERKKAEAALREADQFNQEVISAAGEGIIVYDNKLRYRVWNRFMEELTGKPAAEVLGRRTVDLFPHLREQGVERLLERALSGETVTSPDVALHVPGTQKRGWVIGTYAPHRDAVGRINGVIGVVRDITERKRAEEELVAYQKRLRSLASELALVEQRERRRLATYLHDHIGQNLAMAKIKMDALWPSASKTDLAAAFDEIRGTMGSTIESTRSLTFDLSPPILYELGFEPAVEWLTEQFHERHGIVCRLKDDGQPKPLGDDLRAVLFEAVRELLYNVVKHAQARGATVSLRREGGEIRVMVEDDGVGFARDSAASRQARGGGFGLFNVRERLAHFGGRLQVESAPGRGTCVTLVAPLGGNDGKEQER